jgi:hypothetical protein
MRSAIAAKSRVPTSYSRSSTTFMPRCGKTFRVPEAMNCVEGNFSVSMAAVLGGCAVVSSASMMMPALVTSGWVPSTFAEKCHS